MKLHLPKVLFAAVVAAVCCVQQAYAETALQKNGENITVEIDGTTYNVEGFTGTPQNMNPNSAGLSDGAILGFQTTGGYFLKGGFTYNGDIYISKGSADANTKTGLVLNNGWGGNVYTFTGDVYGDGDIYKYADPNGGVTIKFSGSDMSQYTGNIETSGANATNKLIFENTSTGTGSITSNGELTMSDVTIKNSSITTTNGALVISGNTSIVSTEGVVETTTINAKTLKLSTTINTDSGKVLLSGGANNSNQIIISAADILDGKFSGSVGIATSGNGTGANHVDGNGHLRVDNLLLFSTESNVSFDGKLDYTVAGLTFNDRDHKDIDATLTTAYIVNKDAAYSEETMTTSCKFIALNGATLTLNDSLPSHVTEIYAREAGSAINISGKTTVLNQSVMNVKDGASVKITGDGQYVVNTKAIAGGVSLGDDTEWTGTVVYGYRADGSANLSTELAALVNENSSLVLSGAKGYFSTKVNDNALAGRTLELKDNGNTAALEICNGSSKESYDDSELGTAIIYADLEGEGTITYTFAGSGYSKLDIKGDLAGWNGKFDYKKGHNLQLTLSDKAKEVNAHITKSDANGKLDLVVNNAGETTTFGNTVEVTTMTTTANSSVKLAKGGDVTTGSFSLGEGGTLTLAGGTLTVTDSITLSTVTVDFSQYFDASKLVDKTYSTTLVTAGGITGWAGDLAGTYTADGTEYTTSVDLLNGNSIVLTFKGPDDVVDPSNMPLTVDSLSLSGTVLTLNIDKDLRAMTGDIDLTLSDAALATLAGLPAVEVSLLLQGTAGTIDSLSYDAAISFYGSYVGEGNGMYKVEYIPEPATATLSLLALAGLAARRRRK